MEDWLCTLIVLPGVFWIMAGLSLVVYKWLQIRTSAQSFEDLLLGWRVFLFATQILNLVVLILCTYFVAEWPYALTFNSSWLAAVALSYWLIIVVGAARTLFELKSFSAKLGTDFHASQRKNVTIHLIVVSLQPSWFPLNSDSLRRWRRAPFSAWWWVS